jgi:hypothetical protein
MSRLRTALVALALIALVCGLPFYVTFSPSWQDRAYEFRHERGDLRVRVVESQGRVCAELRQENRHTRSIHRWTSRGKDCAWPPVTGGDGWLAGGQAFQVLDSGHTSGVTPDWLFYGVVPDAAAEVRLTLSGGATLRIPTRPAGKGGLRVYAHQELNAGDRITVTAVRLRDAQGGEIRVF